MSDMATHQVNHSASSGDRDDFARAASGISDPNVGTAHSEASGGGDHDRRDLRRHALGGLLVRGFNVGRLRAKCLAMAFRLEDGQHFSASARDMLLGRCGVRIGAYSYGQCFVPYAFPPGVVVGRYVSIADGVNIFTRNHPMNTLSTHPFFFNACLGVIERDAMEYGSFEVASDAWIGANAIITPGCRRVGLGAVVGAGSVVTKDVPDFAIVVGNPAKVIRMRFDEATREAIRVSRWWERSLDECKQVLGAMMGPVGEGESWRLHPLLAPKR